MYDRIIKLIGNDNLEKISHKKVLIVGIGGVGGTTLETLVRSGFKDITIIDYDKFELSNLNRQILSLDNNIGEYKVDIAKKRYKALNKDILINISKEYLNKENVSKIGYYDYIIDACDSTEAKEALIRYALKSNIKIISCMGTGKRIDPTKLIISTLDKTYNDPLAKVMRNRLKDINLKKVPVVFSKELPKNNSKEISSMMMVPSTAGIYLAYYIINDIIKE